MANATDAPKFREWATSKGLPEETVLDDGTTCSEEKLGAVGDLALALEQRKELIGERHLLVVAGDTLLYRNFSLSALLQKALDARTGGGGGGGGGDGVAGAVVYYPVHDPHEISKRGVVEVDASTGRVLALLEKPDPTETADRFASPAVYAYTKAALPLISQFAAANETSDKGSWAAPGKLLSWFLAGKCPSSGLETRCNASIMGYQVSGRVDIDSVSQYQDTMAHFEHTLDSNLGQCCR